MTCYSCRWSVGHPSGKGVWCKLWDAWARVRCSKFQYEPGTDEDGHSGTLDRPTQGA